MMKKLLWFLLLLPQVLYADIAVVNTNAGSAGDIAGNLSTTTNFFSEILHNIFYVIGIGLVTAAAMRYRDHRNNPAQTPLRTPILFFIVGAVIGLFPIFIQYTSAIVSPYNI